MTPALHMGGGDLCIPTVSLQMSSPELIAVAFSRQRRAEHALPLLQVCNLMHTGLRV